MPRGDKSAYTDKQKRQAAIEEGYEHRGVPEKRKLCDAPGPVLNPETVVGPNGVPASKGYLHPSHSPRIFPQGNLRYVSK